jgi:hypothetical protein
MYSYAIAIEEVALDWESLGPQFDRYSVRLTGTLDRLWVDCFKQATDEDRALARFELDPWARSVTFTCRTGDGPEEVMEVLGRLQRLVDTVNREASLAASRPSHAPSYMEAGRSEDDEPTVVMFDPSRRRKS